MKNKKVVPFIVTSQLGQSALYILGLLPILIAITITCLDVSEWNSLRDACTDQATTIAKSAALELPNLDNAVIKIEESANHFKAEFPKLKNIAIRPIISENDSSTIGVNIQADFNSNLARITSIFVPNAPITMHINRSSAVQYIPGDYAIILANSNTLRLTDITNKFGYSEAATIFKCPKPSNANSFIWSKNWSDNHDETILWTQACYNEPFSTLKQATITLLDAITEIKNNKVTVILTPGNYDSRTPNKTTTLNTLDADFFSDVADEATFNATYTDEFQLNNFNCLLFSQKYDDENYFAVPQTFQQNTVFNAKLDCPSKLNLSPEYIKEKFLKTPIKLRDAVHWQIAQAQNNVAIDEAVGKAMQELLVKSEATQNLEIEKRGNLATRPLRRIIILTDNLNGYTFTPELLENLKTYSIKLVIIVYKHSYLNASIANQIDDQFATLVEQINNTEIEDFKKRNVVLFKTQMADDISNFINEQVLPDLNKTVIKHYDNI